MYRPEDIQAFIELRTVKGQVTETNELCINHHDLHGAVEQ